MLLSLLQLQQAHSLICLPFEICQRFLHQGLTAGGADLSATQKVLVFCAENYRQDIGVKDIAAQLHISESYVSKIFTRKLGCTLRSYLNALRVAQAKELLKHTDRKITDILFACGFRNQGSFNQIFLGQTGITPRAYRQKHR